MGWLSSRTIMRRMNPNRRRPEPLATDVKTTSEQAECPLCGESASYFDTDPPNKPLRRDYYRCAHCGLIFIPASQHITPEDEHSRYEEHENHPDDPGYRAFLNQMFDPMLKRIPPGSKGLDFGSGPGPTLGLMFEKKGHHVSNYDLYYDHHPEMFDTQYDFITTTETVEHLSRPGSELDRLWSCLKEGGWLGIMTLRIPRDQPFTEWHYRNDDTHITFFSDQTFQWLGRYWNSNPEFMGERVVLFRKRV